jgi:hypothetical protein
MSDGTFGVTGEARPLHHEVVEAITDHRFAIWHGEILDCLASGPLGR